MKERKYSLKKEYTLGKLAAMTALMITILHCFVLTHFIQQSTTNILLGMVLDIFAVVNTVLYFKKKDKYSLAVTVFSVTTILFTLAADFTMDIYQLMVFALLVIGSLICIRPDFDKRCKLSLANQLIYIASVMGILSCFTQFTDIAIVEQVAVSGLSASIIDESGMMLAKTSFGYYMILLYMAMLFFTLFDKKWLITAGFAAVLIAVCWEIGNAAASLGWAHFSIGAYLMIASTIAMVAGNSMKEVFNIRKRQLKTEEKKEI